MIPDRWRRIEELYEAARERGAGALEGTDPEIRREVERLLAQDSSDKNLDRGAAELRDDFTETATEVALPGPPSLAGQTISHYRVREKIGAGGMGVVYQAFDTKLGRIVALKFLPPNLSHDRGLRTRLRDEARAASALDHPNIVVIHDIDETPAGDVFIAMAFHEGITLREKIASGIPVREALQIARQIASGLAKAHENGIVHRDIKPSNVVVAKDGIARIIDFGLARSSEVTVTSDGVARGTPLYMSPEQASGKDVDFHTDIWSLGTVLYEMLAGKPPFRGDSQLQLMRSVVQDEPVALCEIRRDLPAGIESIVLRALQKNPAARYESAAEMAKDLEAALLALEAPPKRAILRPAYAVSAALLVLLAAGLSTWFYWRSERRHWAREQAIPGIGRLKAQDKALAAYRLLRQAQAYLPGDPQITQISDSLVHGVSVQSTPSGASVEIKDYLSPDDAWFPLGTTPLNNVKIPNGYLRWRVSKAGAGEYVGAPVTDNIHGFIPTFNFTLDAAAAAPEGMAAVPAGNYLAIVWSLGDLGPYALPKFYIDRFEVTNRQYQEFVAKGGYQKREYWKEKFVRDGKEMSWEQAMELLRDSTGRPGPSTWAAGHYPDGQADYAVGGVSWYEAAAYAEFAGKSLPVIAQWYLAAPSAVAKYIMPLSNFSASPAPVGKYQGVGPFGTYDMAGNMAEWCLNEAGGGARYQLGGGFGTATYEYFEPGGLPPFHRAANAGFRCVRNTAPLPAETLIEVRQTIRDFSKAKPASDAVFLIYRTMYAYDRTPLNSKVESVTQDSADWRKEKITFDAAYGKERMVAYLFLPAHVQPPYQAVIYSPSGRVLDLHNSETLGDMQFIDFVIQSGRAVIYPVYKGTYERPAPAPSPDTVAGRETLIQESKDVGRSIDYLETRPDIDKNRIGYLGDSMGGAHGVFFAAMEDRIKAVVMLDGGFYNEKPLPGTDGVDFAPRLKAPTLLIAGKFDWIFMGKDAMVQMLGAPPADKKVVLLDTAHDVTERRPELIREVVAWFDRYLGKVK